MVNIKSTRLSKGWSQSKLEKITGLSASSISNIELGNRGVSYNISLPSLVKIAHAFEMSLVDLLSQSGYLSAIGDECYEAEKSQIYIHNYELINIYHRLTPIQQQEFVQEIKKLVSQSDLAKQQKMFLKNLNDNFIYLLRFYYSSLKQINVFLPDNFA